MMQNSGIIQDLFGRQQSPGDVTNDGEGVTKDVSQFSGLSCW